jgi:hypothetical protein
MVRLAAIRNGPCDMANRSVGIVMRRPCNRFTGAILTIDKP